MTLLNLYFPRKCNSMVFIFSNCFDCYFPGNRSQVTAHSVCSMMIILLWRHNCHVKMLCVTRDTYAHWNFKTLNFGIARGLSALSTRSFDNNIT